MDSEAQHWACMECGQRQASAGKCGQCGDEPVLDLRSPLTRETLGEVDERRRSKRGDRVRYVSVPVGVVVVVAGCEIIPGLARVLAGLLPFFFGYIAAMIGVALGAMFLANRAMPFKARFGYLDEYARAGASDAEARRSAELPR